MKTNSKNVSIYLGVVEDSLSRNDFMNIRNNTEKTEVFEPHTRTHESPSITHKRTIHVVERTPTFQMRQ